MLVALACAVVGTFVVLRGLAFVADALAHGVLPGIAIALLVGFPVTIGAAAGTAVMMGGVSVITRRSRLSGDTAIGLLFAGMLAVGVMITSKSHSFTGDLTRIFIGDILGVDPTALLWQALAVVFVVAVAWVCRRPFLLLCLDPELATTSGFRVRRSENVLMTAIAAVLGVVSVYAGLSLSYHADLAAGASIVAVSVAIFMVTFTATEVRRARITRRNHEHGHEHDHDHDHDQGGDHGHHH